MNINKAKEGNQKSFFPLIGFLSIILLIFIIPAEIGAYLFKIIDPSISILLFLVSLISTPLYTILLLVVAPQGKLFSNFLINSIVSFGSYLGILLGGILAIGNIDNFEKITFIIISFIWGTISGVVAALLFKNVSSRKSYLQE